MFIAHITIPEHDFQLHVAKGIQTTNNNSEVTYQSFSNLRQSMEVETTSKIKRIKHFPNAKLCNKCHKLFLF